MKFQKSSNNPKTIILGGGMTGLAAGWASGLPVVEAEENPGGICSSYYIKPNEKGRLSRGANQEVYRFENGGGHWIFGGDVTTLNFIDRLAPVRSYERNSSVFFPETNEFVPYPLQNNLRFLGNQHISAVLDEMINAPNLIPATMANWVEKNFGVTLTNLFFGPFHELYTAGLWGEIAPQDPYKSPVNLSLVVRGAIEDVSSIGYNVTFVYPEEGLDKLSLQMANNCDISYGKRVVQIDTKAKVISFADGTGMKYANLISTIPLNQMVDMTHLSLDEPADPYTSVLVLNIGAIRGINCPDDHWLYIPNSAAGFHRVGFYSNVDVSFLPLSTQQSKDRVSIYVEKAFQGGQMPSAQGIEAYGWQTIKELQEWRFIGEVEAVDPTWIDVAYTWKRPGSEWRKKALSALEEVGIFQVGRYARWGFQGIADSIRDGFFAGAAFK